MQSAILPLSQCVSKGLVHKSYDTDGLPEAKEVLHLLVAGRTSDVLDVDGRLGRHNATRDQVRRSLEGDGTLDSKCCATFARNRLSAWRLETFETRMT